VKINEKLNKFLKDLDDKLVKEEMTAGGTGGAFTAYSGTVDAGSTGGSVGNSDSYAPGDARIPGLLGSKKKKGKSKKINRLRNFVKAKTSVLSRPRITNLFLSSLQTEELNQKEIEKKFPKEMRVGAKIEKEHPGVPPKRTASQHLKEFPNTKDGASYYSKLVPMERKLKKLNKKYGKQK